MVLYVSGTAHLMYGDCLAGLQVAQKYLGGNHAVTVTLRNSTMAARRAISARDSKIREELTRRSNRRSRGRDRGGTTQSKPTVGTGVLSKPLSSRYVRALHREACAGPRL